MKLKMDQINQKMIIMKNMNKKKLKKSLIIKILK